MGPSPPPPTPAPKQTGRGIIILLPIAATQVFELAGRIMVGIFRLAIAKEFKLAVAVLCRTAGGLNDHVVPLANGGPHLDLSAFEFLEIDQVSSLVQGGACHTICGTETAVDWDRHWSLVP
jgi:hypothetical protein